MGLNPDPHVHHYVVYHLHQHPCGNYAMSKDDYPGKGKTPQHITRRQAIIAGGIATLGLVFNVPLIRTLYPKPAFANYVGVPGIIGPLLATVAAGSTHKVYRGKE